MGSPKYIVTRTPGFALAGTEGRLWVLAENQYARQKNITYYDHAADGKLEQLAAMAQEMNDALEPQTEAVQIEADKEEPDLIVGIPTDAALRHRAPTDPSVRHGWVLNRLQSALEAVDAGRMNLVEFKRRVQQIYTALEEI